MERQKSSEQKNERMARRESKDSNSGLGVWSAIGGIALLGVAAVFISALPDLKRYIKISRM